MTILLVLAFAITMDAQPKMSDLFSVEPSYEYEFFEEMVTGGDGFQLFTRIYLPKGNGPWPVIVTRTPYVYGGKGDSNTLAREYAKRGIGYIQQDCRGKGGSEGFYKPNVYEREDGQEYGENYYNFYRYLPTVEADVAILGVELPWYRDWITHTDYTDPYWNSGVWSEQTRTRIAEQKIYVGKKKGSKVTFPIIDLQ